MLNNKKEMIKRAFYQGTFEGQNKTMPFSNQ